MQEYRDDKLAVRYDPAICIDAGEVHTRPPLRLRSIEEAVDRHKRRFRGRDHRAGQALPLGRADL
jgi:hypothetical protein